MSEPACFRAVYSDWKLIRTRGVVQLVFEVPVEAADAAYQVVGGMPDQSQSVWCAVARLDGEPKEAPAQGSHLTSAVENVENVGNRSPAHDERAAADLSNVSQTGRPSPLGKSYAQRIAILCGQQPFRAFLHEEGHRVTINNGPQDGENAAEAVRKFCGVKSRSEIRENTPPGNRWLLLQSAYEAWRVAPSVVG